MTKKSAAKLTDASKAPADAVAVPLTRDDLRNALLGSAPKPESQVIMLFGVEVELRQPNLASIMKARAEGDDTTRAIDMIIEYAYVPGTDEHVFETADRDTIKTWPFGKDLANLNAVIAELTGVDIVAAVEGLREDPLGG